MTEGMQQEAAATFADPLAAFLTDAIAKLDALLDGPQVESELPLEAEKKLRKKAVRVEVPAEDIAFEPRAAA